MQTSQDQDFQAPGRMDRYRQRARSCFRSNWSNSFIYPLKGVWYFSTHKYLWPLLRGRLIPLTVLATCVLAILFLVAYAPVALFLKIFHPSGSAFVHLCFFQSFALPTFKHLRYVMDGHMVTARKAFCCSTTPILYSR